MTDTDLCYMSAVDAIAAFKTGKLSPVELMRAVITRAENRQPHHQRICPHLVRAGPGAGDKGRGKVCQREPPRPRGDPDVCQG